MDRASIPSLSSELETIHLVDEYEWLAEPATVRMKEGIDKRDDYAGPIDCGWIGEDRDGIWLMRHPEAALTEHPELWWMVHQWALGRHEFRDGLSNHETEQLAAMCGAYGREQGRKYQRGKDS
jgi:hypothetical protein